MPGLFQQRQNLGFGNLHNRTLRFHLEAADGFDLIAEEGTPMSMTEREVILSDVIDEVFGLGPLEPLLRDPTISDILVNTHKQVYVERQGKLERLPTTFQDDKHLMRVIDRIVSGVEAKPEPEKKRVFLGMF